MTATPFTGLGARSTAAAPPPPTTGDDGEDDFARPSVQRMVPAAAAASPFTSVWQRTPQPTANRTHQEPPMPAKKQRKPRATDSGSMLFRLCAALLPGDLDRDALCKAIGADADRHFVQLTSRAKAKGFVAVNDGSYTLTDAGKEWTSGGANLGNHKSAAKTGRTSPKAVKRTRRERAQKGRELSAGEQQRLGVVPVTAKGQLRGGLQLATDAPRTFRCAVFNDGSFMLSKDGQQVELDPEENAQMLRYLERMAEETAAA
jgi:hypothetical protein